LLHNLEDTLMIIKRVIEKNYENNIAKAIAGEESLMKKNLSYVFCA